MPSCTPRLGLTDAHGEPDELLLGAVVDVALQASPLVGRGAGDPRLAVAQLGELVLQLCGQDDRAHGWSCLRGQVGEQVLVAFAQEPVVGGPYGNVPHQLVKMSHLTEPHRRLRRWFAGPRLADRPVAQTARARTADTPSPSSKVLAITESTSVLSRLAESWCGRAARAS